MDGTALVAIAAVAFVGSHFILSHPLRAPLVARLGAGGFLGVYALVAPATLGWTALAYQAAAATPPLWPVGDKLWGLVTLVMLLAAILLMGSLIRNPAFPDPGGQTRVPDAAQGVFAITRHPMMWAFAIWGLCHILVYPVAKNIIVATAIIILALVGAALQDRKKAALDPVGWPAWQAKTSYWPFAAMLQGRAHIGRIGAHTLGGGLILWLAATWAHIPLSGWPAGIWRWIVG